MPIRNITASFILLVLFMTPSPSPASATPFVGVQPTTAAFGATVTVGVKNFAAQEQVAITWDSPTGPLLTTITANSLGNGLSSFVMPEGVNGQHTVYAIGESSFLSATTPIQERAGLVLNQTSGQPGFMIVVAGGGYQANETVTVTFGPSGGPYQTVTTVPTDSNGGFTAPGFTAPNAPSGLFVVSGTGRTSGLVASSNFYLQNYAQPINTGVVAIFGQPYSRSYTTQVTGQLLGTNLELAWLGNDFNDTIPDPVTSMLDQMQPGVVRLFVAQQNIVLANMNGKTDYHDYFWTKFDWAINYIEANGMSPEVVLWQVADYNAPQGGPNPNTSYPLAPNEWGRVSANFVRHANLDMGFGIHYWEIWNEPNLQAFYQNAMTEPQYVTLFDDAVTQMKAVDPTIAVGGPDLAGLPQTNQNWLIPFLQDPTVQQNVDFITWHAYQLTVPQLMAEIATARQEIQTYIPGRASQIGFGPDEYSPVVDARDWDYVGATGSAAYLTAILQAGATLANPWVAWDIFGFYQKPPFNQPLYLYENMMTTQNQSTVSPRGVFYQVVANQLAMRNQTVDSSSSTYNGLVALATSAGASGPSALVLANNTYYPLQTTIALHFQTVGQHTLSVYTIGDDNVGNGSGQGLDGTLTQTITVMTDNSGNATTMLAVSPWTAQAVAVTGG